MSDKNAKTTTAKEPETTDEQFVVVPDPDANETVEGGKYLAEDGKTLVNAMGEPIKDGKST